MRPTIATSRQLSALLALIPLVLAGCYAKKTDVQAEFARVRQEMTSADIVFDQKHTQAISRVQQAQQQAQQQLGGRIDAIERDVQRLRTELADLNVKVTRLNGLVAFDVPVHFDFGKAELREADRAVLRRFASVVKEFYPGAVLTAEGFTDAAGSRAYNLKLGQKRADAVRQYLTGTGGFDASQIRTASYGEAANRLIELKAKGPGDTGLANRRVVLVLDYVGTAVGTLRLITD